MRTVGCIFGGNGIDTAKTRYFMPREREAFRKKWWRTSDAARAWRCSWHTAAGIFATYGRYIGLKHIMIEYRGNTRMVPAVPAGTRRPPGRRPGNIRFRDSEYQRALALRRWEGRKVYRKTQKCYNSRAKTP